MRNVKILDGLKSGADMLNKWAVIRSNPKEWWTLDKTPGIVWPDVPDPEVPPSGDLSGKQINADYNRLMSVNCF
jgi:hypothetical protein